MKKEVLYAIALYALLCLVGTWAAGAVKKQTLPIFGNANEDAVIDMRDVSCVERMIQGRCPATPLADANRDGRVNTLDIQQIQQIITETEKEITIIDNAEDVVTIRRPVRRVIPDHLTCLNGVRVLGAADMVVGIDTAVKKHMGRVFLEDLDTLPLIGSYSGPDYETVLSLKPDVYLAYRSLYGPGSKEALQLKLPGVTVIETGYFTPYNPDNLTIDMRLLGYILDKRDRAEAYIRWYNSYLNMIRKRAETVRPEDRPKVYPAPGWNLYNSIANFKLADIAGGRNVCAGLGPTYVTVDPEWVPQAEPKCHF